MPASKRPACENAGVFTSPCGQCLVQVGRGGHALNDLLELGEHELGKVCESSHLEGWRR
jgi:hypothetical protein